MRNPLAAPLGESGLSSQPVVVPSADAVSIAQVDAALAGRLARFKQPKAVINVSVLPRNAMGKVQKNQLRQDYAGLFSGGSR